MTQSPRHRRMVIGTDLDARGRPSGEDHVLCIGSSSSFWICSFQRQILVCNPSSGENLNTEKGESDMFAYALRH